MMTSLEKEVLRLELQVVELIRMVANLNGRLTNMEDLGQKDKIFKLYPHRRKMPL